MFFTRTQKKEPAEGDIRIITKFLLLPRMTSTHWAWFGRHTLIYRYVCCAVHEQNGPIPYYFWELIGIEK